MELKENTGKQTSILVEDPAENWLALLLTFYVDVVPTQLQDGTFVPSLPARQADLFDKANDAYNLRVILT